MKAQELVQEIHDAFDNAQDQLLQEAIEIINANKVKNTDHVKRMAELGFTNSKVVQEASKKLKNAVRTAEQAEIVLYYRETYPFLKFLTYGKLDEICEKYHLIYAPVSNYLEDVPEKNLKEIQAAQPLKPEDQITDLWRCVIKENKVKDWNKVASKDDNTFIENWREDSPPPGMAMQRLLPGNVDWQTINKCCEYIKESKEGLFIAAPESHFNLDGLTRKGKLGFFQIQKSKVDDPIVFRYVKHGIQVLSKWGLEANDPELANPLDN